MTSTGSGNRMKIQSSGNSIGWNRTQINIEQNQHWNWNNQPRMVKWHPRIAKPISFIYSNMESSYAQEWIGRSYDSRFDIFNLDIGFSPTM